MNKEWLFFDPDYPRFESLLSPSQLDKKVIYTQDHHYKFNFIFSCTRLFTTIVKS